MSCLAGRMIDFDVAYNADLVFNYDADSVCLVVNTGGLSISIVSPGLYWSTGAQSELG